jgi:hypothetical protein
MLTKMAKAFSTAHLYARQWMNANHLPTTTENRNWQLVPERKLPASGEWFIKNGERGIID